MFKKRFAPQILPLDSLGSKCPHLLESESETCLLWSRFNTYRECGWWASGLDGPQSPPREESLSVQGGRGWLWLSYLMADSLVPLSQGLLHRLHQRQKGGEEERVEKTWIPLRQRLLGPADSLHRIHRRRVATVSQFLNLQHFPVYFIEKSK